MSMLYMTLFVPCGFQGFIYCNCLTYILFPLCVQVPDALGIGFIWRVFFPPVLLCTRGDFGTTRVLKWPRVGLVSCLVHKSLRHKLYPHLKISSYFFIYYYYLRELHIHQKQQETHEKDAKTSALLKKEIWSLLC